MRIVIQTSVLYITLLIVSVNIFAQSKPTPESALSFLNFYYNGQGQGVVLADMKVCTTIEENECANNVAADSLKKDEQYMIWMMYVVPREDKVDNIIVQFNQNGITRYTKLVSVSGSIRYRTWKSFILNRVGEWEIKVFHDMEDRVDVLNKLLVTVVE